MDSAMAELADFARAQDIGARVFEAARDSLRVASINRARPDDGSGSSRRVAARGWSPGARGPIAAAGGFLTTT